MEQHDDYTAQHARLTTILPRGRFIRAEDGTCVAVTRDDPDGIDAHLYEVAPGRLVGFFYVGKPVRFLRALQGARTGHADRPFRAMPITCSGQGDHPGRDAAG